MDSPLTKQGIDNAIALKQYIDKNKIEFDYIYSSPLKRALDTAKIVAGNKNIIIDKRLMEMNFGDYEGHMINDLMNMNPSYYDMMWNKPQDFDRLPNGESYEEVLERIDDFFNELKNLNCENIMIVTHGMYLILIFAYILNINKNDIVTINKNVAEGCSLNLICMHDDKLDIVYTDKKDYLPHISNIKFNQ